MSYPCSRCAKKFSSELGLTQHMEAAHGRAGVLKGVMAWEQSRDQAHEITRAGYQDEGVIQYDYHAFYDNQTCTWDCPQCTHTFESVRALKQHLESGTHEQPRYDWWVPTSLVRSHRSRLLTLILCCSKECGRAFISLAALKQHLQSAGHSDRESRLVSTMMTDALAAGPLVGSPPSRC